MSSFGTTTTVERIDEIGLGEPSPGLVFQARRRQCLLGVPYFTWGHTLKTELRVNDQGLTATGDFGGARSGTLHLPWSRVQELHYAPAGNGEIGGLYAREGLWCSRCILPCLTEAQTDEVIAVIAECYVIVPSVRDNSAKQSLPRSVSVQPTAPSAWRPRWNPATPPPR